MSPDHPEDTTSRSTLVSLVVPALNESENVPLLLQRVRELKKLLPQLSFELVLVDDGSRDGTSSSAHEAAHHDVVLRVIRLARSFGAHAAISAGLRGCRGDCAIVLGADGQEPLSLLTDFVEKWQLGNDVVWGVRARRTGSRSREVASAAFQRLFTRYAHLEGYPAEGPSGVLVDRRVIDEVNRLEESNRNILALIAWLGFTQTRVEFDLLPRVHGESRYTRGKMVKLAVDSLVQFSSMPLRVCTFTGMTVAGAGLIYAVVLVIRTLAGVATPSGWPTILVVVLVLSGIQLIVMGVMGEYLWRAVEESRRRPLYVVRDVSERNTSSPVPRSESES